MSRRDGQDSPPDTSKPGDPQADAPERTEPSQDDEQPDEQQQPTPEGDDAAADKGQESKGDQADKGSDQDKPKDEKADDWKAKYDEGEKKRRDFESRAATAENRAKQLEEHAKTLNNWWRGIVQREAPELYEKIVADERKRDEGVSAQRSTRDASYAAINRVYRDGDKAFGDYLTTLVEDADVRISPQNIDKHRRTFESLKGGHSNGNGNGADVPPREPATAGGRTSTPPRVPAGGRAPSGGDEPVWKPGQPFDVRGNLSAGLKKSARDRGAGRR